MVTEQQVEDAMRYLATTDLEVADWKVASMRAEHMVDVTESTVYAASQGSIEDRKRAAKASPEVGVKMEEYFRATKEHELLRARRKRAELVIELYRSVLSARKAGITL